MTGRFLPLEMIPTFVSTQGATPESWGICWNCCCCWSWNISKNVPSMNLTGTPWISSLKSLMVVSSRKFISFLGQFRPYFQGRLLLVAGSVRPPTKSWYLCSIKQLTEPMFHWAMMECWRNGLCFYHNRFFDSPKFCNSLMIGKKNNSTTQTYLKCWFCAKTNCWWKKSCKLPTSTGVFYSIYTKKRKETSQFCRWIDLVTILIIVI